jgi:hypothetical protein
MGRQRCASEKHYKYPCSFAVIIEKQFKFIVENTTKHAWKI